MSYLSHLTPNNVVFPELIVAKSFWERSKGLLGRSSFNECATMWILECNWIHTFFMQFAIDAVFVDKQLKVIEVKHDIQPGRLPLPSWKAQSVFEMKSGLAKKFNIQKGDQLHVGD